jgi:hypothetical protein
MGVTTALDLPISSVPASTAVPHRISFSVTAQSHDSAPRCLCPYALPHIWLLMV